MGGAAFWKVLGLALTTALGIIGTVTDTKESTATGYRVRPIGWVVAAGILIASVVGGIAQHIDDTAAEAEQQRQLARLSHIAAVGEQNLNRFSGQLRLESYGVLSLQQPPLDKLLRKYRAAYIHYEAASATHKGTAARLKPSDTEARAAILSVLRTFRLTLRLPDRGKRSQLYAEASGADMHWELGGEEIGVGNTLTVSMSGVPYRIDNDAIRSAADFSDRPIELLANVAPSSFDMQGNSIYLIDETTHSPITSAKLVRRDSQLGQSGYEGRTKDYARR